MGGTILGYLFFKATAEYSKADQSYSGSEIFGIAVPVVLGVGLLLLGVVLMLLWRASNGFFGRKTEIVDPEVAAGHKLGVPRCRRRPSDGRGVPGAWGSLGGREHLGQAGQVAGRNRTL